MGDFTSIERRKDLVRRISELGLHKPYLPTRYDPGHVLEYEITGVCPAVTATARFEIDRFVGSGFAGQVYRVRLIELTCPDNAIPGLATGGTYAIKICIPRSGFSQVFRNAIYFAGFQAPFPYQVNPAAARSGVLWQKLIRRAAALRFGDDRCVVDTYATFFDAQLGSFGEINEWCEGRHWRFEIDDEVFKRRKLNSETAEASREYLAKKEFMAEMVKLLHEVGASELARQYEWWTCKSQPNVMKRTDAGEGPADGLTALDFRAGLALLPFLPMSPADIALIIKGIRHGRWVQFDRGCLEKLEAFCDDYPADFADLRPALEELKQADPAYRASQLDITHHRFKLLTDGDVRHHARMGSIQGWKVRRLVDETHAWRLSESFVAYMLFLIVGFLPFFGKRLCRMWGDPVYRQHVHALFTQFTYLRAALLAHRFATLIEWSRDGRVDDAGLERYMAKPGLFWRTHLEFMLFFFLGRWQRFWTEWKYARGVIAETFSYPVRFYRNADFRVQWLTSEIDSGAQEGMLTPAEHDSIIKRVPDPFIQKYLKCVAVHVCTLPITQVVSVAVAIWAFIYLRKSWQEGLVMAAAILAFFQGTPISPGSITRGSYVVYLMIKERNVRNYWVAALVSFWHYVGYLGFPLQMVKEFPALSRFMAGRWATKMVRIIPVFGERGALLEHWIFDTFFNVPLSIKRKLLRSS